MPRARRREAHLQAGIVRKIDLTGDGRDDYLVDFRASFCAERLYMFNGTDSIRTTEPSYPISLATPVTAIASVAGEGSK